MTHWLRQGAFLVGTALPLVAGCASDGCDDLVYAENLPRETRPLVIPQGVTAPAESGDYRIPAAPEAVAGRCMAKPPLTLPEEALRKPGERAAES